MKRAYMIMDLQFGSTGKGALAGYLAKERHPDTIVTAWGPNAGHTYIDETGRTFVHTMVANGIVSPAFQTLLIGPGSVLNLDNLYNELSACADILLKKRIVIHPMALVVSDKHREIEEGRGKTIGSTMKGTGAAVIDRIIRDPRNNPTVGALPSGRKNAYLDKIRTLGIRATIDAEYYNAMVDRAEIMQIEGAQGFSLSHYHGFYPYTTSRDVTPAQVMADCAIPFSIQPEVMGCLRTFPIRVANRIGSDGKQYTSGPGYMDQMEIDWDSIGLTPELTTVTKLPRRIFTFSPDQLDDAIRMCNPTGIFLNFANYLPKGEVDGLIQKINAARGISGGVHWVGVGPRHQDLLTIHEWWR